MFIELAKYGEVEDLNICDNVGEHLAGSKNGFEALVLTVVNPAGMCLDVYVRYKYEEDAGKATESVNERFYDGRLLY
jgi:splicing factor U2AF subunit